MEMSTETTKSLRGFARMSPEKRREVAAKGGKAVPSKLRSFSKNKHLASAAGRLGGKAVDPKTRTFSKDRALAARAGTKGGKNSQANKRKVKKTHEQVD